MKESHRKGASDPSWPRVLRCRLRSLLRSVNRGIGGLGIELRKYSSERRRCPCMRKATRREAPSRVSVRLCVVIDPRHAWKLHAREPGDLGDACRSKSDRPAGEGHKPKDPHARLRGVGQRCSTGELLEQRWETIGGEQGGKTADQGEHQAATHALDAERG